MWILKRFYYSDKIRLSPIEMEEGCLCTFIFLYFFCTYCNIYTYIYYSNQTT